MPILKPPASSRIVMAAATSRQSCSPPRRP